MIGGVEALHSWIPPGETVPVISLGLLRSLSTGAEVWPRYKLNRISGLKDLADPQDVRDNKVGADGETTRLSRRRGKTVVYEGTLQARGLREMREAESALSQAFADMKTEGKMTVSWHPHNYDFNDLGERYFYGKPLTCVIIDVQERHRYFRPFVLSLRMSESVYYDQDDVPYY